MSSDSPPLNLPPVEPSATQEIFAGLQSNAVEDALTSGLGRGQPQSSDMVVVLLHGLCSSPQELLSVDEAVKGAGYATVSMHIPGYSFEQTKNKQVAKSFQGWIDFVEGEVYKLKAKYPRVVLAGISAGANVALGVAVKNSALIDGLVLMSTPLILDGWNIPFYHFLFPLALYTPI